MGEGQKFFKKKMTASVARRKGERVVKYKKGYQLRKTK